MLSLATSCQGRQREKESKEGKKKGVGFDVGDNGFGADDGDDGFDAGDGDDGDDAKGSTQKKITGLFGNFSQTSDPTPPFGNPSFKMKILG